MSLTGINVFALLYGFASSGYVSLGPPCIVMLAHGPVDATDAYGWPVSGTRTGRSSQPSYCRRNQGPRGDRFTGLICFAGAAMLLGGICIAVARVAKGWNAIVEENVCPGSFWKEPR